MLHILYANINKNKHYTFLNKELLALPPVFRQKVLKYKRWEDQQAALLGRVLLKTLIKAYGCNLSMEHITYSSNQKPYFKSNEIFFNISHTDDIVVCTVTDVNEIGIDIEKLRDIDVCPFKNMLTRNEWQSVNNSCNPPDCFIALWTKKEAIIKASGHGLSLPLNAFEISDDNKAEIENTTYSVKEIFIDEGHKCHLAIKGALPEIIKVALFLPG